MTPSRRAWLPDAVIGGAVTLFGLVEAFGMHYDLANLLRLVLIAVGMGVAAGLYRLAPVIALTLVWLACGLQVLGDITPMLVQVAAVVVAFGCARYGSAAVVWASGLSIPTGCAIACAFVLRFGRPSTGSVLFVSGGELLALIGFTAMLLLTVPWLVGLALRARENARRSRDEQVAAEAYRSRAEAERTQAEELAGLRAQQNQLARDVHDVVGHSLAVILAQAESAQFLPEGDTDKVRVTMANIADSARQSLRDVREVLAPSTTPAAASPAGLDSLVDGVRAAGNDVRSTVVGSPQPLPPELEVVAFRVLQEMLTNALKHGRRGEPVHVERHWEGELRIEVRNVIDTDSTDQTMPIQVAAANRGLGVDGMRRRLEAAGGRLDVRRREEDGVGPTFTATAWVPLRARG